MLKARLFLFCLLGALASCGSAEGDRGVDSTPPPPQGKDRRIRDITDPTKPDHPKNLETVAVSAAVVLVVDGFDETTDGRSKGTVYVQDVGSKEPYSGISLFAPTYVPGNLHVSSGDVLDLRGPYQENTGIGTAKFAPGAFLTQLARPVTTFRYEFRVPEPTDIDVNDLTDPAKARKWLNMLVRVKNITLAGSAIKNPNAQPPQTRVAANLLPGTGGACDAAFPKPPTLVNELMDLEPLQLGSGTRISELVGVVTFFCNYHIAPRSAADIKR